MAFTYGTGGNASGGYRPDSTKRLNSVSSNAPAPATSSSYQDTTNWVDELRKSTSNVSSGPDLSGVNKNVDNLRKEMTSAKTKPDLPKQINLKDYGTQLVTIDDISKKYGFDYSRGYAERQAEQIAQAKRDQVEADRARVDYETESARTDLDHDVFGMHLEQRQGIADAGLNAGIAEERNLQLEMQRQYALSDILADNQLSNQELDRELGTITAEELVYAEELYNKRMQEGFGNAMDMSRFMQSENQWQGEMAIEQRGQQVDEAWREFEFNNMNAADRERFLQSERQFGTEQAWREFEFENMSASERASLLADAEKFGMNMAWERHKFDAGLAFEAGNISSSSLSTSKGEPPSSFTNHLSQALSSTGYSSSWAQPMSELIARESTWNPNAKNPNSTAHGYGQFLNSTRKNYEKKHGISYSTPVNQLILTMHYVKDRYGTPQKALAFHNKNNWY